jgi:predicted AlkP superfamily phosphohydrolase/phosphomutase
MIPQRLLAGLLARSGPRGEVDEMFSGIDWSRTKAFAWGVDAGAMISINLKGRNPEGIVQPGYEYELLRQDIIDRLGRLPDPVTGERVGIQVFRKEEVYHGKYLASAPDILFLRDKYVFFGTGKGDSEWEIPTPFRSGMHALQGVFMAYGPDIRKSGEKLPNLKIYDITPTVLHMFGLPIVKDMDGRVLTEIFTKGSEPGERQITYRGVDYEAERIKDRVRRLRKLRKL